MRLQRALARAGVASRRAAEDLIREGQVKVNGEVASIGRVVDPERDRIVVGKKRVSAPRRATWLILNKPTGYVTTRRDPQGRPTVFDLVPEVPGLTYVGRLDVMTEGLLVMSSDGDAANRLTHPRFGVRRTYVVDVTGGTPGAIRTALDRGVMIDNQRVEFAAFDVRKSNRMLQLRLTLTEGRKRIVRRVCETLGLKVERLVRVSHGPLSLGGLASGEWRYLTKPELARVRQYVND